MGKWGRRNLNHGIPEDTEKGGDFEQETERTEEIRFWALGRRKAGIRRRWEASAVAQKGSGATRAETGNFNREIREIREKRRGF